MSVRISPRITATRVSATFAINRRAKELRSSGRKIAHFGFGESPFPVHPKLLGALREHAGKKSYPPVLGLPVLREAIARHHQETAGYDFDAARIAIAPGSKAIIFQLLQILECAVAIPSPSWVSYAPQARILGKTIVAVQTSCETGYKITPQTLDDALGKAGAGTALILNSPSNPTGQVFTSGEIDELAAICRRRDALVISDEIYAPLDFSAPYSPGIGCRCPERTIVTGGLSKAHSAGGWRLGFAAACSAKLQPLFNALEALISETYSCVSSPVQHAACVAYSDDEEIRGHVRDCARLHRLAADLTRERLLDAGLRCAPAGGGFYLFPNFYDDAALIGAVGISTSRELAQTLLEKCEVASLPGEYFSLEPAELALRMSPVDYDGSTVLEAYVKNGRNIRAIEKDSEHYFSSMLDGCERLKNWLTDLRRA